MLSASNWATMAARAIEAGYVPGNSLETKLLESLDEKMKAELGEDLESYLQVQVNDALNMEYELAANQDVPLETATELAMDQLFKGAAA